MVRDAVEQPGHGRVLVVDGGGSLRCALFGGNLAVLAAQNGWAGVVVNGAVRDVDEIDAQPIGVRGLAAHPRRSEKGMHSGQAGLPVVFAGVGVPRGRVAVRRPRRDRGPARQPPRVDQRRRSSRASRWRRPAVSSAAGTGSGTASS